MTDTFSMKIGNIPPKEQVSVRLSYFQKLTTVYNHVDFSNKNRILALFCLPLLMNLRYTPRSNCF